MNCVILPFILILPIQILSLVLPNCQIDCTGSNNAAASSLPPQCPCLRAPGSDKCVTYDTSQMATTLDEALTSFPNLASSTYQKPLFPAASQQQEIRTPKLLATAAEVQTAAAGGGDERRCSSAECRACRESIADAFDESSRNSWIGSMNETDAVRRGESGLNTCGQPLARPNNVQRTQAPFDSTTKQIIHLLQESANGRKKRQDIDSGDKGEGLIGVSALIGCDYRRGTALSDDVKWSGLCNICWQWRKLPNDYYPTYLNEVACDSKDSGCLAGFGKCRPVFRSVNVLRNRGNESNSRWEETTINTVAACECQVEVGTALHSLVSR